MRLFDSHIHMDDPRFDDDRPALLMQARDAGVVAMIVPGVSQSTWVRTEAVCGEVDGAFPAFGLHPYFLGQHQDSHIEALAQRLDQGDAIAVGECGLDFAIDSLDRDEQTGVFDAQLALAAERDLPAIVHSRKAVDQVWSHLRAHAVRAHIHSFAGSEQQAKRFVDLGCVLGIGATITFDRAQKLRRVVRAMPLDALCIETDAPDQPGQGHQGERHEPAWITEVVKTIAEVRGESAETIAEATFQNARRFFRLESVNVG